MHPSCRLQVRVSRWIARPHSLQHAGGEGRKAAFCNAGCPHPYRDVVLFELEVHDVSLALKERAPTDHRPPFRGWSTSVSWSILPEVCTHRPALLSLSTTDSLPWLPCSHGGQAPKQDRAGRCTRGTTPRAMRATPPMTTNRTWLCSALLKQSLVNVAREQLAQNVKTSCRSDFVIITRTGPQIRHF